MSRRIGPLHLRIIESSQLSKLGIKHSFIQGTGWHRDMSGYRYRVTPGYDRVHGYRMTLCYDTFMLTWCKGWHCVTLFYAWVQGDTNLWQVAGWHQFITGYRLTPQTTDTGCEWHDTRCKKTVFLIDPIQVSSRYHFCTFAESRAIYFCQLWD